MLKLISRNSAEFVHVGADVETADKMTTYSKTAEVIVLNSSGKDLINTSIGVARL